MAKHLIELEADVEVAGCLSDLSKSIYPCLDSTTPLVMACKDGRLEIVQFLIQKCHADVEEVGMIMIDGKKIEGVPPLWCAAAAGHLNIVKTLIKHKASVNNTTRTMSTPLRAACYKGNFEMVKFLIENGADINIANCQGHTCLMAACYKGHYEICDYLISLGAKLDAQDLNGSSALKICVSLGNVEMAKHLIKLGANVEVAGCSRDLSRLIYPCLDSTTPLVTACNDGQLEMVQYLIKKCHADVEEVGLITIDDKRVEDAFPLWCAAAAGHLSIVKTLIECKASINSTAYKSTPLCIACYFGHFEVVKYLIKNGADVDILNYQGATCLMVAIHKKHYEIFKYLVKCGANVNTQDESGNTALHMCVDLGMLEMTKYLIKHGADIEATTCYGGTCLIIACEKQYNNTAKYLMLHGANINQKNLEGNTALHKCSELNNLEMVKLLYKKGAKLYDESFRTTPLITAANNGHGLIVDFFIKNCNVTKEDQINLLELLGALEVDKAYDINAALAYWQKAMALRYENNKCPIKKCLANSPLSSYLDTNEVCTVNQLTDLNIADTVEMMKQSLLVRERILGDSHPDTTHYIRVMGANYRKENNVERCIQLWTYAFEVQLRDQEPLISKTAETYIILYFQLLNLINEFPDFIPRGIVVVLFQSVLHVFKIIMKEIEKFFNMPRQKDLRHTRSFSCTLCVAVHHLSLFCKLFPHLNQFEILELKEAVHQFVLLNPTTLYGLTPLHLACSVHPISLFLSVEIIDLLLEVGANPDTMNEDHNTPFHLAVMHIFCTRDILDCFLKHGAHLDYRNLDNLTPLQLTHITPSTLICPLRHLTLQCLCAQAINTYKIPYKGVLSKKIHEFLYAHCPFPFISFGVPRRQFKSPFLPTDGPIHHNLKLYTKRSQHSALLEV